jgi:hypothetical protein
MWRRDFDLALTPPPKRTPINAGTKWHYQGDQYPAQEAYSLKYCCSIDGRPIVVQDLRRPAIRHGKIGMPLRSTPQSDKKGFANSMRLHPDVVFYITKKKNRNTRIKSETLGSSAHVVPEKAFPPTPGVSAAWLCSSAHHVGVAAGFSCDNRRRRQQRRTGLWSSQRDSCTSRVARFGQERKRLIISYIVDSTFNVRQLTSFTLNALPAVGSGYPRRK